MRVVVGVYCVLFVDVRCLCFVVCDSLLLFEVGCLRWGVVVDVRFVVGCKVLIVIYVLLCVVCGCFLFVGCCLALDVF